MTLGQVAVVVFDLDNTLINRQRALARWLLELARRHQPHWAAHQRHAFCRAALEADQWGYGSFAEMSRAFERVLPATELTEASLWKQRRGALRRHVRPDRRVLRLLERLRIQGLRLAVASNGSSVNQRGKLRAARLAHLQWAEVAISQELGVAKPHREFFERIGRRLDTPPERLLMVGDNWQGDVGGASDAGWRTCWVSWGRPTPEPGGGADLVVEHVSELGELLGD